MKVASIVGARPQFIKVAVVSRALRKLPGVRELLIHPGQHYDENLSSVFFQELEIPQPDYCLGIGSASHGAQTGRMLEAIETVLLQEKPDRVVVYGDTNTTLAGALAAAKLHLPVAHVEAGLRSFNRKMPEEINRVLTDHLADLLFVSTDAAVQNLRGEGIEDRRVHRVGDVMYDAALFYAKKAETESRCLGENGLKTRQYAAATIHRAENTDDPLRLRVIMDGLTRIAESLPVVFPVHPRTRAALSRHDLLPASGSKAQLLLLDPVGYLDMVMLEKNARLIITDSGGVQKEAFFYRVPCVTVRDETEWVELVELGWNRLAPPVSPETIVHAAEEAMRDGGGREGSPYGDGSSAQRIAEVLLAATRA